MTTLNIQKARGPKQRREREKEALRQVILDAARELFVKEGYENVSMRRIADKIEYSPTTIYLYFEDKAALLFAVCEETFAKLAKRMESISRKSTDPVETLKRGCRAYVEFGLKYPNHYRVTFINHPDLHLGRENYLREGSMGMRCYSQLRANVEECIKQKRFRHGDLEALTQMMWAGGHGVASLLITKPDFPWVDKDKLIDLMIDVLIDGLKS
jgi:AcrR family transcriptional regulator